MPRRVPARINTASGPTLDQGLPDAIVYLMRKSGKPMRAIDVKHAFNARWPGIWHAPTTWGTTLSQLHRAGQIERIAWGLYQAKG